MREVIRGKRNDPQKISLIIVYTLAKALAISPLEIYKMPANRLETLRLGRVKVDGKVQSVYKFSKAKYEECEEMELKFQNKMRQQASKRAIANFGKGKKGK